MILAAGRRVDKSFRLFEEFLQRRQGLFCKTAGKTKKPEKIFSGFNAVRVVELNDEGLYGYGQLAGLLRARYCEPKIRGINKTDGLTWKVKEILEHARADIAAGLRQQ